MPRDIGLYLEGMLEAAQRMHRYLHGIDRQAFTADPRTIDAVVRNLQILGESAARGLGQAVRLQQLPHVLLAEERLVALARGSRTRPRRRAVKAWKHPS